MVRLFRPFKWAYAGLWLVRLWFALYGLVLPFLAWMSLLLTVSEEGKILGFHTMSTWEWHPDMPARSVFPAFMTTGSPLCILKSLLGPERLIHPLLVFRIQRLTFLCLSSILDYSVLNLVSSPASRRLCLLLLASSYVTYTFQVRPFSNSLESVLVSLCLVLLRQMADKQTGLKVGGKKMGIRSSLFATFKRDLHVLAVLAVIGVFTRPTFVAFALPIGYQVLKLSWQVAGSPSQAFSLLLPPLCTATLAASVVVATDTYYFRGDFSTLVVTPYNFVRYNLLAENLADHGIHPNWLHVGINLPMLLGPLFVWVTWCSIYKSIKPPGLRVQKVPEFDILRQTLVQVIILSLAVLSVQPHQEPRFLIPLVLPIIVLTATAKFPRPGKFFWTIWIIFNAVLALVFGILHQGGVVPSLLSLHSTLRDVPAGSSTHIVYWKTYMPPRHLLGVSERDVTSGRISLMDLSGAPQHKLIAALSAPPFRSTYLVTPVHTYRMLPIRISSCMSLRTRLFPHLDLDHILESIQAGSYDGLSLGIYAVEPSCVTTVGSRVGNA